MTLLAPTLQAFFSDRLMGQRGASSHTIAAYRDSIRLLLRHAADRTHKQPCQLDIADLDAPLVASFLEYVERGRHDSVRTRNNRLAAIHSLSVTQHSAILNTLRQSSVFSPFRRSGSSASW